MVKQKSKSNLSWLFIAGGLLLIILGSLFVLKFQQKNELMVPAKTSIDHQSASNNTANWKTYTNSIYNYSIKYPDNWNIIDSGGKQNLITLSSLNLIDGSPAVITIYVRKTEELVPQWQQQYKPFYAIDSKQKGENTYILRASSYEEGVGISKEREKLAIEVFNLMLPTLKFTN